MYKTKEKVVTLVRRHRHRRGAVQQARQSQRWGALVLVLRPPRPRPPWAQRPPGRCSGCTAYPGRRLR
jgi:hypothetical protein